MVDNIFGRNLEHLRRSHGETLEGIGLKLNAAKSTIKGYENGSRKPDPSMLQSISKHFGVPVDALLSSDLSDLGSIGQTVSMPEILGIMGKIFPLFSTPKAMENENFKRGMDYTKKMLTAFQKFETVRGSVICDIFEAYLKAVEEDVPEAVANALWAIFIWWSQIIDVNEALLIQSKALSGKLNVYELNERMKNPSPEIEAKRKGFIEDFDEIFVELIKILKSDLEWADLGDYYIALRYVNSMIDSGYSSELNSMAGMEMMLSLVKIENPYAYNFVRTSLDMK